MLNGLTAISQTNPWIKKEATSIQNNDDFKDSKPEHHSYFSLNKEQLLEVLENAPKRGENSNRNDIAIIFPVENDEAELFSIYEASVFSESLSQKYPDIKSYVGYSTSGSILRFSVDPRGIQATIQSYKKTTTYIQFLDRTTNNHVVYSSKARDPKLNDFTCSTPDEYRGDNERTLQNRDANDQLLRTYRMAVSTTGEYAQFHGGTVAAALAAINATITRVNMVFETDISATFEIQDFDQLIFTESSTDPFADFDVGANGANFGTLDSWGAQLQNHLTEEIGNAAYDIGHLFATNSNINGNAGCLGCVCDDDDVLNNTDNNKGSAYTSSQNPTGEYFDLVTAHEIGHQMGANHTFSFQEEGSSITNSEPGSGSTIMGYAGITGGDDVQSAPDPYFHYHSIRQMTDNFASNNCWLNNNPIALTNTPPMASAGNNYTIPIGTAYILRGDATDADSGDNLSYCWEGTDNGGVTFADFGPTYNVGSMVRSLPPSSSPNRYIPKLSRVAANQLTETNPTLGSDWETVSTIGRTLNYALTVRDRAPSAVGLNGQTSYDTMQIIVDETTGPFMVTSQSTFESWPVESEQTITWNIAGTDTGAINSSSINILLSIDGGQSFPITLASNIPNSGSADITVPFVGTDPILNARVIVASNDNIFFAMNSSNFQIQEIEFELSVENNLRAVCAPDNAVFEFVYEAYLGYSGETTFTTENLPAGLTATFNPLTSSADGTDVTVTISGTENLDSGANFPYYFFDIVGTSGGIVNSYALDMFVFDSDFTSPVALFPEDNASGIDTNVTLNWETDNNTLSYIYELDTDPTFNTIVASGTSDFFDSQPLTDLETDTRYYWRITPTNTCGSGASSQTFSFVTQNCSDANALDLPIDISPDDSGINYTSVINITEDILIEDLNVLINIDHTYNGDLQISLTGPNGTTIDLSSDNGGSSDNYTNTIFDSEASESITSGTAPYTGSYLPEGDLSFFYGISTLGEWTLSVTDTFAQDGGTINTFSLEICSAVTSLSIKPLDDVNAITIFPNPNNGNFTIVSNAALENVTIDIYDINGRLVFKTLAKNQGTYFRKEIKANALSTGVYFVELSNGIKRVVKKLIIR